MAAKIPDNIPCKSCRADGGDKTGDHMYHVRHPVTKGYLPYYKCRKCSTIETVSGDTIEAPLPEPIIKVSKATVDTFPHVADRGINMVVRKEYGVRTSISPIGEYDRHFYPITRDSTTLTYKFRDIITKNFGRLKSGISSDIDLFGKKSIKGTPKSVLITEGEEDAMAAHQMLKGHAHNLACLSLPDGSNNMKAVEVALPWLQKMDKVYFCPDQDVPGLKVIEKMAKLLPNVYILEDMGEKDANAMLQKGLTADFKNCFSRAKKYAPSFLVEVTKSLLDEVCVKPTYGRAYPWPTLQAKTYGMRDGEGIFVGAGVKMGKSEWINELVMSRILSGDGDIPAVIKFEEKPAMTIKKLAGKNDGVFYHRPDMPFKMSDLRATAGSLKDKLYMYKSFGPANWDIVANYIRYVAANGSKTIIIDPITKLTNHLSPSDTETELRRISNDIACMAQDLGFFYIITCHLKAPPSGKTPHERGGRVESNQFRGSRAMMENCYYMLGIERNKDPALTEDERNTSTFVLLDDRAFGNTAKFDVFYDKTTGSYLEPKLVHLGRK